MERLTTSPSERPGAPSWPPLSPAALVEGARAAVRSAREAGLVVRVVEREPRVSGASGVGGGVLRSAIDGLRPYRFVIRAAYEHRAWWEALLDHRAPLLVPEECVVCGTPPVDVVLDHVPFCGHHAPGVSVAEFYPDPLVRARDLIRRTFEASQVVNGVGRPPGWTGGHRAVPCPRCDHLTVLRDATGAPGHPSCTEAPSSGPMLDLME